MEGRPDVRVGVRYGWAATTSSSALGKTGCSLLVGGDIYSSWLSRGGRADGRQMTIRWVEAGQGLYPYSLMLFWCHITASVEPATSENSRSVTICV
jgi:hypothetical protein